ncbi:VanW family protein [Quadrisphaera sp. INWT6]|uniref:VanW family protein n=1 Tax=Quadrisphaera sp. INWT6 TaxID=2596917 RepID=UPI0018925046|nr:VanW family protein [Quadrisphaera sp. INWT6]MBF5080474.1 hypothetical protein [Quadrisphaera sp. INWT6]
MGGTNGTLQLLEILERQSEREAAHGRRAAIPAPRRAARVDLPVTGPAAVAGPPVPDALPVAAPSTAPGAGPAAAGADGRSRARVLLAVAGLGLVAACWSGASAFLADRVPEGTTVAGTPIGGLDRAEAARAVEAALQPRLSAPLPVQLAAPAGAASPQRTASIDPAGAGLELDAAATVSRAIGPVGLPTTLWRQLRGGGDVAPAVTADPAALAGAVDRAAVALDVPPVEGSISFATGQPAPTEPVPGLAVDRAAAAELVRRAWLAPLGAGGAEAQRPLVLPSREVAPQVTSAEVADALARQAQPALAAPLAVSVSGRGVVLAPAQVLPALSVVPADGALRLDVDGAVLAAAVVAADPATRVPAVDAALDTSTGTPVVVPSADGSEPDPDALAASAEQALLASGEGRTAQTGTRPVAPALTTEDVAAMGVVALLGQVVSPLTADPARTTDVTTAARALDGALVAPGGSLDVAALIGAPTAEAGYVPASVVVDGRATTTLAAGSTQVASAVLAAAYAAGLQVDARTAPESWNPRDPVGLDAVVGPDAPLSLSEPGATGALLRAEVVDGSLRVQVWGGQGRAVSLQTAPASDPRPALQVVDTSPQCVPQPGQDGFTTTVTRTTTTVPVEGAAAAEPAVDELTTTYAPRTAVTCAASALPAGSPAPALD